MTHHVDHTAPLCDALCRCRTCKPPLPVGARLAKRGILPVTIQRTVKRAGDKVLHSWAAPVEHLS